MIPSTYQIEIGISMNAVPFMWKLKKINSSRIGKGKHLYIYTGFFSLHIKRTVKSKESSLLAVTLLVYHWTSKNRVVFLMISFVKEQNPRMFFTFASHLGSQNRISGILFDTLRYRRTKIFVLFSEVRKYAQWTKPRPTTSLKFRTAKKSRNPNSWI